MHHQIPNVEKICVHIFNFCPYKHIGGFYHPVVVTYYSLILEKMPERICGCRDDTLETKKSILRNFNAARVSDDGKTIYIGVVFHICFQNYVTADVEADVVHSIDLLNKDFNKQCSNFNIGSNVYTDPSLKQTYESYVSLADECNIQFYKVDTKYKPLSSQNSSNISVLDNNIKRASPAIEPNKYLNVWVADFSNGLLGYAQFPWDNAPSTDGVVIAKGTFGRKPSYGEFNLNKTLTHEVGHWLGLYHTFQETFAYEGGNIDYQDGTPAEEIQEVKGDCVADTPPQGSPTYGNPFATPKTWPSSRPIDESKAYRHMFMNFMDYSDDIALFMFTKDQKTKIRQMIRIYRPDILTNNPTNPTPDPTPDPIPTPTIFTSAVYNFEVSNPSGWAGPLKFLNNNSTGTNVQITTVNAYGGTRCLRARNSGRAELKVNLTGVTNVNLSLFIRAENYYTYVWVKPPGSTNWYSARIPSSYYYRQYTFSLPGPFNSVGNDHYTIRFGTEGSSSLYSYFDNVTVTNTSAAQRLVLDLEEKAIEVTDEIDKKIEKEKVKNEKKIQKEKEKAEKAERKKKEKAEKAEKERLEKEKKEKEKAEKAEKEKAEKAEKERLEKEKKDKADKEKLEKEKKDKADKEKLEKENKGNKEKKGNK
ncbi:ulilysin [Tupanvirus deep ocean]|uniref:Ulilysin n=2 Tax=Tupanvirus TaxID=2094720 RepID=A0AC62A7A3_9VIRU|nr:ulilysin [Tupanvirus deep ocean]QKU33568.1 ulilysin [Tupanvirus deep ocean]